MPGEEDNLWNVLQGLGLTGDVRTPQLDSDAIARAQGDDQILGLLKLLDADLSENSLPSECDPLMERLSFTSRSLPPESRRREWSGFLKEQGVYIATLGTWAIARWYQDRGQLDHAAAVYEGLDGEAHEDNSGLGYDYLLDMMDVYGDLGEYDRVRDLFADVRRLSSTNEVDDDLFRRAKQALAETVTRVSDEIKTTDLREMVVLLKNELSDTVNDLANAKFESERLRAGVHIPEERLKAQEWLDTQTNNLRSKLCGEAWSALVDAVVFLKTPSLKDSFYWCIPVACQRAVEAEFNKKVWALVRDKVGAKKLGQYKHDRSINQIYDVLNPREMKSSIERAFIEGLQIKSLIKDAAILTTTQKLKVLEEHSTDARHGSLGGKAYSKERLIKFAQEIELAKPDGWIFRWLGEASCIR
jgi:hypothetical protein